MLRGFLVGYLLALGAKVLTYHIESRQMTTYFIILQKIIHRNAPPKTVKVLRNCFQVNVVNE
jgi:hypothetical protein